MSASRRSPIHGRTRAQMYRGEADWTLIGKVKNNPRIHIPIIGNGDVDSGPKAAEMFDRYGVDGVMIGRATYGRPWIFREVKHYLATGEVLPAAIGLRAGGDRQGAPAKIVGNQRRIRGHPRNAPPPVQLFQGVARFQAHTPEAGHAARHPRAVRHARLDRPSAGAIST